MNIHLDGKQRIVRQAKVVQHQGIELGFDGPDGDVFAVGCLVDIIEGGGSVEDVAAAFVLPEAAGAKTPHHGGQQGRAVGHGAVDDLTRSAVFDGQKGADHAESQHHATATEITDQIERRHRGFALATDHVQSTGGGDIVDVVTGAGGIETVLAPARHPPVNQLRIVGQQHIGAKAETLHHAGAEAFDQAVRGFDEVAQGGLSIGGFQIEKADGA